MKHWIAIILLSSLLLSMAACSQADPQTTNGADATDPPASQTPTTDPPTLQTPATDPPATEPPATLPAPTNPPISNVLQCISHTWISINCTTKQCTKCNSYEKQTPTHIWEPLDSYTVCCAICLEISCPGENHDWVFICIGRKCTNCLRIENTEEAGEHDWSVGTCTSPMACYFCGTVAAPALGHNWISINCTTKQCTRCDTIEPQEANHSWVSGASGALTCTVCGAGQCVGENHNWLTACTYRICTNCDLLESHAGEHSWKEATCTTPKSCTSCGATEGSASGHSWSGATCTAPNSCQNCGATQGSAPGHDWVFAACNLMECTRCFETKSEEGGHYWIGGSCTEPRTCLDCGTAQTEAPGHNWQDATCSLPKLCYDCGATEGAPTGKHIPVTDPGYPPTCTEPGLTDGSHCADCGMTITPQNPRNPYGHSFEPGSSTCKFCDASSGGSGGSGSIDISIPSTPILLGDVMVVNCKAVTYNNFDGTYNVTVYILFTNLSSASRTGGVWCTLSGLRGEGTAITLAPGDSGTCTVDFRRVSGGNYTVMFG